MRSYERLIEVLALFSAEKYQWSAEEAAEALGVSVSSAYRYFKSLADAGLMTSTVASQFSLGPAIIAYDRLIQTCDPMLQAAMPVMMDLLVPNAPPGSMILLARLYRDKVVCVHQIRSPGPQITISFERGRPMPLFRGATSKVILANLKPRVLRRLYDEHTEEINDAALGRTWEQFRINLRNIRREGISIARGEVDRGRVGISAPVFGTARDVQGSLTVAVAEKDATETIVGRLSSLVSAGAYEIETLVQNASKKVSGARRPGHDRMSIRHDQRDRLSNSE